MSALIITRGIPGSGKTTAARKWVAKDPTNRIRINRDDTRVMMHGSRLGTRRQEEQVTVMRDAAVVALLKEGWDVICDDTHLPMERVQGMQKLAEKAGANFVVWDMTNVPLDVCLERNWNRQDTPAFVPPEYIVRMHQEHVRGQQLMHFWPTGATASRPFACDANDGFRSSNPSDVTCPACKTGFEVEQ